MQPAVTTDRESELRCGVSEARACDNRYTLQLAFALDYGRQGVLIHIGGPLELPERYAPHTFEATISSSLSLAVNC
jgi:hypothetical protein